MYIILNCSNTTKW